MYSPSPFTYATSSLSIEDWNPQFPKILPFISCSQRLHEVNSLSPSMMVEREGFHFILKSGIISLATHVLWTQELRVK